MPGYLDQYGAGDEQREKRNKLLFIGGGAVLVLLFLWFFFFVWDKTEIVRAEPVARLAQVLRNHRQEGRVKAFVGLVQHQDYQAAYAMWGCTEAKPCKDYPLTSFMQDWGPGGTRNLNSFAIPKSRSCGTGVIVTVDFGRGQKDALWVQRSDLTIGFSPFPDCSPGA